MSSEAHQLTDLQIAIMRVLWAQREATVAEVAEALRDERNLAGTTVATLLSRLERRGVVRHHTRARQFVYYPVVSESDVRRSMVSELTERLFDGDVTAMVSHLLAAREMSPGDLEKVQELLADHARRTEVSDDDR